MKARKLRSPEERIAEAAAMLAAPQLLKAARRVLMDAYNNWPSDGGRAAEVGTSTLKELEAAVEAATWPKKVSS